MIWVITILPFCCSTTNRTLSPTLRFVSMEGSAMKTIVIGGISSFDLAVFDSHLARTSVDAANLLGHVGWCGHVHLAVVHGYLRERLVLARVEAVVPQRLENGKLSTCAN